MNPTTARILQERQPISLRLSDHERHVIACALLETKGNVTKAAALAGISRRSIHRAIVRWPDLAPKRPPTRVELRVAAWRNRVVGCQAQPVL